MNKQWLALCKGKQLYCHLCGLLILDRQDLCGDHSPIPRSKGGKIIKPAHRWCDNAQGATGHLTAAALENLVKRWLRNKTKFNQNVFLSIEALKQKGE
jgi:hypothetical protein